MENECTNYLEEDTKLKEYSDRLLELRKDGVNRISELKQEIAAAKRNKLLEGAARKTLIDEDEKKIAEAKTVASKNAKEIASLSKEAVAYSNGIAKKYISETAAKQKDVIVQLGDDYKKKC